MGAVKSADTETLYIHLVIESLLLTVNSGNGPVVPTDELSGWLEM